MSTKAFHTVRINDPLSRLLHFGNSRDYCAFFITSTHDFKAAIGAKRIIEIVDAKGGFAKLEQFQSQADTTIAGYLGYDLKNDLEVLSSQNPDCIDLPEAVFFEPQIWIYCKENTLKIEAENQTFLNELLKILEADPGEKKANASDLTLEPLTTREEYISKAKSILKHLQRGDIYEANYCIQFHGQAVEFDPVSQFLNLLDLTEAPFSVFSKLDGKFVLSASPERYLKNNGGELISQPIKGTIKRSKDEALDKILMDQLKNDPKEQSENVMIVDLVRNDLSRVATRNSVCVKELFGVGTFKTVHHLVSTVAAQLNTEKYNHWDAIRATFPMGSMTGAPKISAMKIIEAHESFKRGAYSGGFGWISPNGDFDFNVLIRTILYNQENYELAFSVGSAITIKAIPEKEYDECLLKAEALINSLKKAVANELA